MPFTQPFIGYFTKGDLVYGLAPKRTALVLRFGAVIIQTGASAVTVDQFRKSLVDQGGGAKPKEFKQFLRDNEKHANYSGFAQAVRSYNNDEEKFAAANALNASLQNAAWRAKSKFGMEWLLGGNRGIIHFVLDGIDMAAVVSKNHSFADPQTGNILAQDLPLGKAPANTNNKERTVTHSELRWIYRNRANPLVSNGVQFWFSPHGAIATCGPPWTNAVQTTTMPDGTVQTWQQAWTVYQPTTERNAF